MIRTSNGSGRRILTFPAVHPSDDISLPTLLSSLIALSHKISTFSPKCRSFPCNKRNAATCVRFVDVLHSFFEEIVEDRCTLLPGPAFLDLHFAFQKLLFLLDDFSRDGAGLWMLMESGRVATIFRALSGSIADALDVFPFDSVEVSVELKEQLELVMKQARRGRFEIEGDDERAMVCVVEILKGFERRVVPGEGDLRWILDYVGVKGWSDCNREVEFLGGEIRVEEGGGEKVGFLWSLMGFMSYCRCVVMEVEVADGEECNSKHDDPQIENALSCFKFDDFRCPISLELMADPVTIETGHTYDRSSILRWFRSGNRVCPKTGKRVGSIDLVPNLVLRKLVHRYCTENGVPFVADQGQARRMMVQPAGCLAAEEALKMVAGFLGDMLENGARGKKNRAAYEIRVLTKTSVFSRTCLVESGSIPFLLKLLTYRDSSAQENAIAALLNLSKHPKGRAAMVKNRGIESIVSVLSKGLKIESRHHAAATLFYLASSKQEYGGMIGEEPEAVPSLIRLIEESGSDRGKKIGFAAMLGLLMHHENHRRVIASGAVPLLINMLKMCEKEDLVADSLAVLATLAEKKDGTTAILRCGALDVAVEILRTSTSSAGKEQCVSLLLSLSVHGGVDVVAHLVRITSLMGSLYSQLSEGTAQSSNKASALIRTLHDFNERRPILKTRVLPQEQQFIHVW